MDSKIKPESEIEIRLLRRDEFQAVYNNSVECKMPNTLDRMYLMYDALTAKGYRMFGAVDKNGNILSKLSISRLSAIYLTLVSCLELAPNTNHFVPSPPVRHLKSRCPTDMVRIFTDHSPR